MNQQEEQKPNIIPPNFIEKGKFMGGMFDIRNAIEGGILAAAITFPVAHLPLSLTIRIIILCMTALFNKCSALFEKPPFSSALRCSAGPQGETTTTQITR